MVEVVYKRNKESEKKLLTRPLPETWDEMTDAQYLIYCEELCKEQSEEECRLRILKRWMGLSDREFLRPKMGIASQSLAMTRMSEQYFEKLFPVIDFLFRVPGVLMEGEKTDPAMFTRNFIPTFRLPIGEKASAEEYAGPSDKLLNLTGEEIEITENIYAAMHSAQSRKMLAMLAATLYRERDFLKKEGDLRVPFKAERVQIIAERFAILPDYYLHGIRLWYERCMMHWAKRHPRVFKPSKGTSGTLAPSDPEAWRKLIRAMAGAKRGTVEDVRKMHMGDMMFELDQLEQEREAYDKVVAEMKSKSKPK